MDKLDGMRRRTIYLVPTLPTGAQISGDDLHVQLVFPDGYTSFSFGDALGMDDRHELRHLLKTCPDIAKSASGSNRLYTKLSVTPVKGGPTLLTFVTKDGKTIQLPHVGVDVDPTVTLAVPSKYAGTHGDEDDEDEDDEVGDPDDDD